MSEDLELTGGSAGIDRRDFIRKSAIVGGMVWAAPMISSIGSPAFAITPNGEGDFDPELYSYLAVLLKCNGYDIKAKWENGAWVEADKVGAAPQCITPEGPNPDAVFDDFTEQWENAHGRKGSDLGLVLTGSTDPDAWILFIPTVPATEFDVCTLELTVAKAGAIEGVNLVCDEPTGPVEVDGGKEYTFVR